MSIYDFTPYGYDSINNILIKNKLENDLLKNFNEQKIGFYHYLLSFIMQKYIVEIFHIPFYNTLIQSARNFHVEHIMIEEHKTHNYIFKKIDMYLFKMMMLINYNS